MPSNYLISFWSADSAFFYCKTINVYITVIYINKTPIPRKYQKIVSLLNVKLMYLHFLYTGTEKKKIEAWNNAFKQMAKEKNITVQAKSKVWPVLFFIGIKTSDVFI